MKKDKYLQIFSYLLQFSKIRSNPIRDIESQETQYPEILWLNDIPENELFENVIRVDFCSDNEYWIKISKPKEPVKPGFAILPKNLQLWVEPTSLLNDEKEPFLKESFERNGKIYTITDFPEIQKELHNYVNEKWLDDLIDFRDKMIEYKKEFETFEVLNNTYKQLFRIYNKTQQFGEEYELVVGIGLLNFKEGSDKQKIFRHIITQRVDISFEYSQKDSQIYVSPNVELSPQIETDSIIDLFDQFDSQNIIDAESAAKIYMKEKEIDNLLFDNLILDALKIFAERFSPDGKFDDRIEKPDIIETKPTIYFSPALLLRKRNTKSFTALYEKIIENIKKEGDNIEIPPIDGLTDIQEGLIDKDLNPEIVHYESGIEPIYFPKEYNDEQIEIVEKARRNSKVLVQGPPGTGKSHTIANLICHLLANGKKILVTAYTKRALEVLKEKLPIEFQNLVVNLLSGDSSSIQGLQASVNAINDELSRDNLATYKDEIEQFSKYLSEICEKIAFSTNELIKIKEKATRKQEINSAYIGTLSEIAERLEMESNRFGWYEDSFCNINNRDIVNDLQKFIELNNKHNEIDISEFDYLVPCIEYLPTAEQIQQYYNYTNNLLENYSLKEHIQIKCSDYSKLKSMLIKLAEFYDQASSLQIDFGEKIITTYLYGNRYKLRQKLDLSSQILNRIQSIDLKQIDRDIEITYDSNKSLKQLKNDANLLLNYLNEGNMLSGVSFTLKKPFLSKELKERLYFIENIKVNGSSCDRKEEFMAVIQDIELQQDFNEISQLWNLELLKEHSYFNKFSYCNNVNSEIAKLFEIIDGSEILRLNTEKFSDLQIEPFNLQNVNDLIVETEYNYIINNIEILKEVIRKAEAFLNQNNIHPIAEKIVRDIKQMDYYSYEQTLSNLDTIVKRKAGYQYYKELEAQLQNIIPNLIDNVLLGRFTKLDLSQFQQAIYFRHAQNEIHKLLDSNYEQILFDDLKEFELEEKRIIAKIASRKAWCNVLERLRQNRTLRQHLEAWVQAVKKIGKTGKGKRALRFRKEAQLQMEKCKFSVPCWIMPLYKVTETIQPEQEMYDYVIIDEASQLGPDAIFLLYISKNIIIVGDDKQTSPEYVGVDVDIMMPYINKHLKDIPFANYYGTEFSFFDHARRFCDGITVLREHFRCMPEIIEFSNKHFYAPDGKWLYPLKQYSEDRLEPLQTIFCPNGYISGKRSKIINEPEANSIADTITDLIVDKRYEGKSFGVIVLQGNQQAAIIENLLLRKIGESEFHKRKIICGNSASFQGDERDIIFLSLVTAHNHDRSALTRPEDERRFNVAVSRAKEQIWLFHSIEMEDLSNKNDLRYKLLDHFKNYHLRPLILSIPVERTFGTQPEPFDSWFEVDVYNDIVRKGYSVIPQYEVAKGKYIIDLVALFPNGAKIAIECDGDKWHGADQYQNDIMRQKILERCGWQFFRVRGYEYYTDRVKALKPLWGLLPDINSNESNQSLIEVKGTEESINNLSFFSNYSESNRDRSVKQADQPNTYKQYELITTNGDIKEEKQAVGILDESRLMISSEILIFTNKWNVYKLKNNGFACEKDVIEEVELEEGEKPVYITGTTNFSGFLITAYENGKIAKVYMSSFKTKTNRKRLRNAYTDASKLVFIDYIETDIDLIAVSTIEKVVLFNTSDINPTESTKSLGVQIIKLKGNSKLKAIKKLNQVKFENIEYYRKNIPATGNYKLKMDEY